MRAQAGWIVARAASRRDRPPSARRLPCRRTRCGLRRAASPRPGPAPATRWPDTPSAASSRSRSPMAIDGIEEIADQQHAGKAAQPPARRQALAQHRTGPRCTAIASASLVVALRLADGRVRPRIATRSPPRTSSSAAASIRTMRALALRHARQVALEIHGRREVGPQPDRVRRLPFALAHVEMIRARRAAPVDETRRIARMILAELPERLARSRRAGARAVRARP